MDTAETAAGAPGGVLFDPFDPAFRADPYPFYEVLRRSDPVHVTPFGMTVLSRYEDVAAVLRSNDFSRNADEHGALPTDPERRAIREQRVRAVAEGRVARTILDLDPPDHTRLRRLVSPAFVPRAIEPLRPVVQRLVDDALDRADEAGEIELIDDLAFPVPFEVICRLLDLPTDSASEVRGWSQALTGSLEPTATLAEVTDAAECGQKMRDFLAPIIAERRRRLGDDLLSRLIAAEEEGDKLSTLELISFATLLFVAGHETTVNLIGNGVLALLRNRDQLALWRDDPSIAPRAVDELIRYDGPVQLTVRFPFADTVIGGTPVAAGTMVMTLLGAANHDPAMFDDPHRLWLDRPNANRHLGFSAGIHYCLGSALARLETEVAIGSLIRRFPTIELTGEPHWRDRLTIRGVDRLPLALR